MCVSSPPILIIQNFVAPLNGTIVNSNVSFCHRTAFSFCEFEGADDGFVDVLGLVVVALGINSGCGLWW
jgi:hypothetical protein